jgi:oligopeptide transport system substrate-binding protein
LTQLLLSRLNLNMGGRGGTGRRSGLKIRFPIGSAGSSPAVRTITIALSAFALVGCGKTDDPNHIDVSIIGEAPRLGDPDRDPLSISRSIMMRETAMGLVSIDASGQIQPALAESWIVSDDGLSVIFRIHRVSWPDGSDVTGDEVAASLKRALAANSENQLKPLLTAIDAVVGMTGRVVEIRLKTPRPYLLQLLAQPELGIRRDGTGLGPWRITGRTGNALTLRPTPNPAEAGMESPPKDERVVLVKGGRASLAIARFLAERSHLVLGGTAADWPIAQISGVQTARIHLDPAEGLFGLAIFAKSPVLKERALREALSMAIDRDALVSAFKVPRWTSMLSLLPGQMDSGQPLAMPSWANASLADRQATARQRISSWESARGPINPLRMALPAGPGMRLLFARIAADWKMIGVPVISVPFGDKSADLRLIDEVAPNTSANWYLTRTGCNYGLACSDSAELSLTESRTAPTLGQRSAAIARADAIYTENAGYIALAKPLRWSMVSQVLSRYRDNGFAVHPFKELRPDTREN